MDITKPNIYDPADHPEEWTPEMYRRLEQARDIIEEWWLPNRRQLDRLGGVLAMTEMSDVYNGLHKSIIDAGFYGRTIPREYGGQGWNMYQPGLMSAEITKMASTKAVDDAFFTASLAATYCIIGLPMKMRKRSTSSELRRGDSAPFGPLIPSLASIWAECAAAPSSMETPTS